MPLETLQLILTRHPAMEVTDYFTLMTFFNQLMEDGFFCKTVTANEEKYMLTGKGREAVEFFKHRIPYNIRMIIDREISHILYSLLIDTSEVKADIMPYDRCMGHILRCRLVDNTMPLLEMSIYVGDRRSAEAARDNFTEDASNIYMKIIEILKRKPPSDE